MEKDAPTTNSFTYSDATYWDKRWKVNEIGFHKLDKHLLAFFYHFFLLKNLKIEKFFKFLECS